MKKVPSIRCLQKLNLEVWLLSTTTAELSQIPSNLSSVTIDDYFCWLKNYCKDFLLLVDWLNRGPKRPLNARYCLHLRQVQKCSLSRR